MKRIICRHKECGGFILPDIENSFTGMNYGYCSKCGKVKLTSDDFVISEENITLYVIMNKDGEYLLIDNDGDQRTIEFESKEQAHDFAKKYELTDYEVVPNTALYCDKQPVTNGKMIIGEE